MAPESDYAVDQQKPRLQSGAVLFGYMYILLVTHGDAARLLAVSERRSLVFCALSRKRLFQLLYKQTNNRFRVIYPFLALCFSGST